MADYNPHAPDVVGNEWVPIRAEPWTFALDQEVGTLFRLAAEQVVTAGRFYLDQVPPAPNAQIPLISIYPLGEERLTGPVRQVDVPVNAATLASGAVVVGTTSAVTALVSPADPASIDMPAGATMDLSFAMNAMSPTLSGKRIIALDLIYAASNYSSAQLGGAVGIRDTSGQGSWGYGSLEQFTASYVPRLSTAGFGEINPFLLGWPAASGQRWPWTYPQLQRFESSAASKLTVQLISTHDDTNISYAALRVTYCEERRLAVGGVTASLLPWTAGGNAVDLRPPSTLATGGVRLPAGAYSMTVTLSQQGTETTTGVRPAIRMLRQLYDTGNVGGVQVTRPSITAAPAGADMTITDLLPQLSVHTATAAVAAVHPYGTMLPSAVYGTQVVQQDIDGALGLNIGYRYARFYARPVGSPAGPLVLASTTSRDTQRVQLSAAAAAALPEIVDGWREVTLAFPDVALPTFGSGRTTWEWSAPSANASRYWEILAARADSPSSGTAALGPATYGTDQLRLATGTSTAPAAVTDADATLMFLREPPAVTGLTVTSAVQTLAEHGDCGTPADGSVTGIGFLHVSADKTAAFDGTYEVQRCDDLDPQWATVMQTSVFDPAAFADYEARIGVTSRYRIRVVTQYGITGPWSLEVSGHLPAPGAEGPAADGSVLIFTANSRQDGTANLAYATVFDRTTAEEFTFPEADQVVLQRMYGRDMQTAFRQLERGGDQFTRTILVNTAAVSPALRAVRTLRDLAWADLPYVCVRDERGNRWFATVTVPSASLRDRRRLILARVEIAEVSTQPYPINPNGQV